MSTSSVVFPANPTPDAPGIVTQPGTNTGTPSEPATVGVVAIATGTPPAAPTAAPLTPGTNAPAPVTLAQTDARYERKSDTQTFDVDLTTGETTVAVAFPVAFASIPTRPGPLVVVKANAADDNTPVVSIDSLTAAGFNANLQGPAPAGAKLHVTFSL